MDGNKTNTGVSECEANTVQIDNNKASEIIRRQMQQAGEDMGMLAKEIAVTTMATKKLLQASIETLLAGSVFLDDDLLGFLESARTYLSTEIADAEVHEGV